MENDKEREVDENKSSSSLETKNHLKVGSKIILKGLDFRNFKSCEILNRDVEKDTFLVKLGSKINKISEFYPLIIGDEVYSCFKKDPKRKLALFRYIGPYSKLEEIFKKKLEPQIKE